MRISAKTGEGLEELAGQIEAVLRQKNVLLEGLYPYCEADRLQLIRRYGELEEEDYREDGVFVRAYVPADLYDKVCVSRQDSPNSPL